MRARKFSSHIAKVPGGNGDFATRMTRLARLRRSLVELFPERHLYVRSGGAMKAFVLTTKKQMMIAGGVAAGAMWMGVSTAALDFYFRR